jgi:cytochrome bd ubiquinol oxidase subunit I
MDVELLSRIQFGVTVSFHYLFPPWSIGLGLFLVFLEATYLRTRNEKYKQMAMFWVKVFGLTFAFGVATGMVQVFEFGTNWANYSRFVGDVFGSALGAEGIFAFLLEAGFLAILLFGWHRVGPGTHFFATLMVTLGAIFSAIWIVVANSWMQTPAGYLIEGEGPSAHAVITSFWGMVFNPSSVDRLIHVLFAAFLTGAYLVISISAFYLLKQRHVDFARVSMKIALWMAIAFVFAQLWSADSTARGLVVNQPSKLAAMEGVFKTQAGAPMNLIGWTDARNERVFGLQIPGLLSFLSFHDFSAVVIGLDDIPREDWPNVQAVFQFYHLMIYMWGLMLLTAVLGAILWKKILVGRHKWLLWTMVVSAGFPQVANQAGWYTAEMGRQPWIVWHLLRRSEGLSEVVSAGQVLGSIIMFIAIYLLLFVLFVYLLHSKIVHGPEIEGEKEGGQVAEEPVTAT